MFNIAKHLQLASIFLSIIFATSTLAADTFEEFGTVERIDIVSKTIILDGRRFLIDGNVMVNHRDTEEHILNILEEGDIISATGSKDAMNNSIIKSAVIITPREEQ